MGAIIGAAPRSTRARLGGFGAALGATFQIADDILDVEARRRRSRQGDRQGRARGKATLVGALGLDAARAERDRLAGEAVAALDGFGPEADLLRHAARFAADRRI